MRLEDVKVFLSTVVQQTLSGLGARQPTAESESAEPVPATAAAAACLESG